MRLSFYNLEEEKAQVKKGEIMAVIANTIPRRKGDSGYTYMDFLPSTYKDKHDKANIKMPKSSPEIMRDRIAKYNKDHPNEKDLIFDYNKFKN